jgi:hypothetical protein
MTWYHHNTSAEITSEQTEGYFGFVYLITHIKTGQRYVGKKFFTKSKTKQVKGKKKKIRVASDWETYWGSNTKLQEDVKLNGEEEYTREVLHLCKNRSECSYWETYEIFNRHALMTESYYNEWVSCRIRKAHLIKPKP